MLLISACSQKKVFDSTYYCQRLKLSCTRDNQIVFFATSKGNFEVELFGEDNPVTVSNFIENVKKNIYKDKKFYKIINYPQLKVIHSGVYQESNYFQEKNQFSNKISPSIPLEIKLKKVVEPKYKYQIKNPIEILNVKNLFEMGSIAMVKRGDKESSSTEFFLVTNKIPELDGRYSIFGRIVKGFEVLEKIDKKDYIYEIKVSVSELNS